VLDDLIGEIDIEIRPKEVTSPRLLVLRPLPAVVAAISGTGFKRLRLLGVCPIEEQPG
jgi:hypothetical protein